MSCMTTIVTNVLKLLFLCIILSKVLQKSQIGTLSECAALAPRSIQTAKVISHTEAFNYVWLNGSCLASRMTSRLNNRTIRALSGADGNTT